jgi:serine/threonine protein kinase
MEPKYSTLLAQIFHPPFDGIDETDGSVQHFGDDMICKVTNETLINKEISMYQYLKDTGLSEKYKDYLLDIDKIKKYRLTEPTLQSFRDVQWEVEYELVMPFIPYPNLLEYFFHFKMSSKYFSIYSQDIDNTFLVNDTRKPVMTIDIFLKIWTKVMLILINMINDFNEHNFYHDDIKPNNILYNPETDEFKLIDLGISKIIERPLTNDLYLVLETVLFFLYVSLSNATIERQVTNIIKKIETFLHESKIGLIKLNKVDEKSFILTIFDEITQLNWDGLTDSVDDPIKIFVIPLANLQKLTHKQQIEVMNMRMRSAPPKNGGKKNMSKKKKQKRRKLTKNKHKK